MKIAICDDEQKDIERLKSLIERYDEDNHIGFTIYEYCSATDLLRAVRAGSDFDMIFLDINMDDMDGLTLSGKIREKQDDVPIILVTAFMNYALDGYKVRAMSTLVNDKYLLPPSQLLSHRPVLPTDPQRLPVLLLHAVPRTGCTLFLHKA